MILTWVPLPLILMIDGTYLCRFHRDSYILTCESRKFRITNSQITEYFKGVTYLGAVALNILQLN